MSDLKTALLDAKYIDMISLGDFVVRDCGLPDVDADGNLMPQANEIAAALFRWAADMEAEGTAVAKPAAARTHAPVVDEINQNDAEYDEHGDPIMDAPQTSDPADVFGTPEHTTPGTATPQTNMPEPTTPNTMAAQAFDAPQSGFEPAAQMGAPYDQTPNDQGEDHAS